RSRSPSSCSRASEPRPELSGWAWFGVSFAAVAAVELGVVLVLLATGRRRHALEDARVPRRAKVALWLTLPYLASPLDLIPDFVPVVGQLDDALLAGIAVRYVARSAGRDVVTELWPGSEGGLRALLALAY